MNPKTPLPWSEIPCYFDNQCAAYEPQDAEYMLMAANSYLTLRDFPERIVKLITDYHDCIASPHQCEILRELKETIQIWIANKEKARAALEPNG
jgi:hypothetical protein